MLERVIREINILEGVILGQITIGLLAYAGDIALLGEDLDMINRLGSKLIITVKKLSLTVNENKTKYLVASRKNSNSGQEQYIKIEEHMFKRVVQFDYLGSIVSKDNAMSRHRFYQANKGYYSLEKVLKL